MGGIPSWPLTEWWGGGGGGAGQDAPQNQDAAGPDKRAYNCHRAKEVPLALSTLCLLPRTCCLCAGAAFNSYVVSMVRSAGQWPEALVQLMLSMLQMEPSARFLSSES